MDLERNTKGSLIYSELKANNEPEATNSSCIEGLNEFGIFTSFMICFLVGITIQLLSFDSGRHDFIYWFIFGNVLMVFGICFIAKPSYQISNLNKRKRKHFGLLYLISFAIILFYRMNSGGDLFVVLCFFAEVIGYFQYARTYVELFNNYAKRFLGNLGNYEE